MKKDTLLRLSKLSSEVLAEALFDLASQSEEAKSVVEKLTQTADEAYKSTKRAVSALKRSSKFIHWREINSFTRKLESIVQEIDELDISDKQRFELICNFFETDNATFSRVDDSSGYVQTVYKLSAQAVFDRCANQLSATDQALVADRLVRLLHSNDYGIRDHLLDKAVTYFDDKTNRELISQFSSLSDKVDNMYDARSWLSHILHIAKHLKDVKLYELTALESVADFDEVPISTKFEIATTYFDCEDYDQAKTWMEKIEPGEHFMLAERNKFLVALHGKLGNHEQRDNIARSEFKRAPSAAGMESLLRTIGEQYRASVVQEQLDRIASENEFTRCSLSFLLDTDQVETAAHYTLRTRDTINGDHYWDLPTQGEMFLNAGYSLAAICIYRALLDSILRRGITKTYYYGVRYLIALDQLEDTEVPEGMRNHEDYKQSLTQAHGKKYSFWKKYESARSC